MPSMKKIWESIFKKVSKSRNQHIRDKTSSELIDDNRVNVPKHKIPSRATSSEMNNVNQKPVSKTEQRHDLSSSKIDHRPGDDLPSKHKPLEMNKVDQTMASETEQKSDMSSSKTNHRSSERQTNTASSKPNDDNRTVGSKHELPSKETQLEMSKVDQIPVSETEQKPDMSSSETNHKSNKEHIVNDNNGTIRSEHKLPSNQTSLEKSKINQVPVSQTEQETDLSSSETNVIQYTTSSTNQKFDIKFDSLDISLLEVCNQTQLISVEHITNDKNISGIKFLARGSYGQVFIAKDINHNDVILKESIVGSRSNDGSVIRNHQTSDFALSDLINSQRLSQLNSDPNSLNYCSNFANVLDNYYIYHHDKNVTTKRNEYIISKQTFGGKPLCNSDVLTPKVGLSVMSQIVASIAVAEEQLKFEHRDLHQNNVLIDKTNDKYGHYRLKGNSFKIKLNGIKVTLIDNTFSRTELNNQVVFNDLTRLYAPDAGECEDNELEMCYQKMNEIIGGQWNRFCPKTNIVWLQHVFSRIRIQQDRKRYCGLRLTRSESDTINSWKQDIGKYDSVLDFVENDCKFYKKAKVKLNESIFIKTLKNVNIF